MTILAFFEEKRKLKKEKARKYRHPGRDRSHGLWTRCDNCGIILYIKHLKENQLVCFGCGYHLRMNSQERMELLIDPTTWKPLDETISPCDPLEFQDHKPYSERLREAQERTGLQDAIQTGTGMLDGIPVALGVMDFHFMGGSMGSVVGEKITRLIEYATQEGLTLILISASGGARMQEGVFGLMQMAKISSALQIYQSCANLLYISVPTSPTTGGVTASFAMLGDVILAEPKALIGFAGRRVIEQTLQEILPEGFQTSEYMFNHGLLDLIVPRCFLKQALSEIITLHNDAPFKRLGFIPRGAQNKISFITEEKVRRKREKNKEFSSSLSSIDPSNDLEKVNQSEESQGKQISILSSGALAKAQERLTSSEYREILTSFHTMFALLLDLNEKNVSTESQESKKLLTFDNSISFLDNKQDKKAKAIALASQEILEWRAFYINQKLSQNEKNWDSIYAFKSKISKTRSSKQENKESQKEFFSELF